MHSFQALKQQNIAADLTSFRGIQKLSIKYRQGTFCRKYYSFDLVVRWLVMLLFLERQFKLWRASKRNLIQMTSQYLKNDIF